MILQASATRIAESPTLNVKFDKLISHPHNQGQFQEYEECRVEAKSYLCRVILFSGNRDIRKDKIKFLFLSFFLSFFFGDTGV
jgi:hypothetical protein